MMLILEASALIANAFDLWSLCLSKNYNFHQSLDDKCHRFLNAVEPGTEVPIHRHPTKDETLVILRGKVKVSTYDDEGNVKEDIILCPEDGKYGIDIKKNVWHSLESLECGSVIFECKEGPFVPRAGIDD